MKFNEGGAEEFAIYEKDCIIFAAVQFQFNLTSSNEILMVLSKQTGYCTPKSNAQ